MSTSPDGGGADVDDDAARGLDAGLHCWCAAASNGSPACGRDASSAGDTSDAALVVQRLRGGLMNHVWRVQCGGSAAGSIDDSVRSRDAPCGAMPASVRHAIIKYAPPYIASAPRVPLSPARLAFEVRALMLVPDLVRAVRAAAPDTLTPCATTPRVWAASCDPGVAHAVAVLEDVAPCVTSDEWLASERGAGSARAARSAGAAVGHFLAALHVGSFAASKHCDPMQSQRVQERPTDAAATRSACAGLPRMLPADFNNADIQATRRVLQYATAAHTLALSRAACDARTEASPDGSPVPPSRDSTGGEGARSHASSACAHCDDSMLQVAARCEAVGTQLAERQGMCLTQGDCWLPSFLVSELQLDTSCVHDAYGVTAAVSAGIDAASPLTMLPPRVSVIDWEFTHWGNPAQDVAHLVAHCLMHASQPHALLQDAVALLKTAGADGVNLAGCEAAGVRSSFLVFLHGALLAYARACEVLSSTLVGASDFAHAWAAHRVHEVLRVHTACEVAARLGMFSGDGPLGRASPVQRRAAAEYAWQLLLARRHPGPDARSTAHAIPWSLPTLLACI
ncbi:hypothetical protein EON67_00505 [archaeon]|nr:MAG: hypothetical protein EON67_00505 [archaeon]